MSRCSNRHMRPGRACRCHGWNGTWAKWGISLLHGIIISQQWMAQNWTAQNTKQNLSFIWFSWTSRTLLRQGLFLFFFSYYLIKLWKKRKVHNCVEQLIDHLTKELDVRLCALYFTEGRHASDAHIFTAAMLATLSSMLRLSLPSVNILSKIDTCPKLPARLDTFTEPVDLRWITLSYIYN